MDHLSRYAVDKKTGCWLWNGPVNKSGYGIVPKWTGTAVASRYFFAAHKGSIPPDMEVCHTCDTPRCVNPDHLWLGTRTENQRDAVKKGRHGGYRVKGEANGQAALKEAEVLRIFVDPRTQGEIAREYGVHRTTVNLIKNRKKWGWLTAHLQPHKHAMGPPRHTVQTS